MEHEYIEREALFAEFDRLGLGRHSLVEKVFADGVYAVIDSIPAADVAPVVHGRWLRADDFIICSRCEAEMNQKNSLGVDNFKNFCPNCGARMDGDSDAE